MVTFGTNQPYGVSKEYAYKTDLDLEAGDIVVVKASELKLCTVVSIIEDILVNAQIVNRATKWIVDKVDMSKHIARINRVERMDFIKNKLEEKKKAMEEIAIFEMLAKADPEAAKLLNEMKQLTLDA